MTQAVIHFAKTSVMRLQVYGYEPDFAALGTLVLDGLQEASPEFSEMWSKAYRALNNEDIGAEEKLYVIMNILAS